MLKELDVSQDAKWKQRFRASTIGWTQIATQNPDRGLVCTNRDGIYQLYAWDVPSGELTRLTHHSAGVVFGSISADGEWIYYLDDAEGNELGHFVRIPFAGGEFQDLTPDMPDYASWYITESHSGNLVGLTAAAREWGFRIYVINPAGEIVFTYENENQAVGPNLSHDGTIAVIATNERSGSLDMSLEAYDIATGKQLGELYDEGASIDPIGFVPQADNEWYLAKTSKTGFGRPLLWHPRTGERRDLKLESVAGDVQPWDWTEDGRYLLLREIHQAQYQLYLYDLEDNQLIKLEHPSGSYNSGYFVGNDTIFVNVTDSLQPNRLVKMDMTGNVLETVLSSGDAPEAAQWQSVTFAGAEGDTIQAWLVIPEGDAPYPTIVHTHGGPTAVMTDSYSPAIQSWVDHGFAVFSINYHGSTTFGKPFQKSIEGNLGELEVLDIEAGVQWLLDNNIAHPEMILKTGGSYGGYLTLMALGKAPSLWAGGMADVAIADWTLMYEDQAETLRSYQKSLFGGAPEEMPEQMAKSSPITYVEAIKAPIHILQGENDTRCPSRQMHAYEDKMKAHNKHLEIVWFNAGHGSRAMGQSIEHQELKLRFAYRVLG